MRFGPQRKTKSCDINAAAIVERLCFIRAALHGMSRHELTWQHRVGTRHRLYVQCVRKAEHPFFRGRVPYAVAWIDLDEGPRLLSNVVGVVDPAKDIKIGQRVMVEWEAHDELSLPLFRLV